MIIPADLRLRLVAAFALVTAISQLHSLPVAAAVLAATLAAALAARPERRLWRRLLHVEGFVLVLFATLPFAVPGASLFTLGPLSASVEGVARAALVACKISASVLVILTVLGGIDTHRLGGALRGLRLPEPLVRLFVLTARYVGVLREEAARLREAMRARAFRPGSNRHTWRSYGNLVGMLLVRALERARRVEEAMALRGYDGRFPYAALPAPAVRDWAVLALFVALAAAALAADRL
jgi:cobalt/nickel transport system permease protein